MSAKTKSYYPDAVPGYVAEDPTPANLSWLDNYRPPCHVLFRKRTRAEVAKPVARRPSLYLVHETPTSRRDTVPMPLMRLVNDGNASLYKSATREDILGALAYGTQTIERACSLMEGVLSQSETELQVSDVEPYVDRLNDLLRRLKDKKTTYHVVDLRCTGSAD